MASPIAVKPLGVDQRTGLQKELRVKILHIDTESERVIVTYDIVLIGPTGVVVAVVETDSYTRTNIPGNMKFDQLRQSPIGAGIGQLIAVDMDLIQGPDTYKEDLKQSVPAPEGPAL